MITYYLQWNRNASKLDIYIMLLSGWILLRSVVVECWAESKNFCRILVVNNSSSFFQFWKWNFTMISSNISCKVLSERFINWKVIKHIMWVIWSHDSHVIITTIFLNTSTHATFGHSKKDARLSHGLKLIYRQWAASLTSQSVHSKYNDSIFCQEQTNIWSV